MHSLSRSGTGLREATDLAWNTHAVSSRLCLRLSSRRACILTKIELERLQKTIEYDCERWKNSLQPLQAESISDRPSRSQSICMTYSDFLSLVAEMASLSGHAQANEWLTRRSSTNLSLLQMSSELSSSSKRILERLVALSQK